jgi:hypothetical protein
MSAEGRSAPGEWLGYLVAPLCLLAVAIGLWVLRAHPTWLFGGVVVAGLALALGWVFVSALWPAKANRTCPTCGEDRIERLDPTELRGLRCAACGWEDPNESAWFLAEDEEEALEDLVQAQRRRRRAPGR